MEGALEASQAASEDGIGAGTLAAFDVAIVDDEAELLAVHGVDDAGELTLLPGGVLLVSNEPKLQAPGLRSEPGCGLGNKGGEVLEEDGQSEEEERDHLPMID